MEILKYTRGKNEYEFVCETWERTNAWGHRAVMMKNGYEIQENKVRYYNRTWEIFRYQTVINGAIYNEIDLRKKRIVENYKYKNDLARISQAKKDELYQEDEMLKELEDLKEFIGNGNRGGEF